MQCPDCGGPMWDNRESKRSPKHPDYKCKNRQCDKAVWLEKRGATPAAAPAPTVGSNGNGATRPTVGAPIGPIYAECFEFAKRAVTHYLGDMATADAIVAATATLFIQAMNSGRPIKAAKPAPPPPPPPEPEYAGNFGGEDLPF